MDKNRLKHRRKKLGLTLLEVANYIGVSESTVSRWESGNIGNMRSDKIEAMSKILKTSPLWIMGFDISGADKNLIKNLQKEAIKTKDMVKQYHDSSDELLNKVSNINTLLNLIEDISGDEFTKILEYIKFIKHERS